jgi:hypothetical protein
MNLVVPHKGKFYHAVEENHEHPRRLFWVKPGHDRHPQTTTALPSLTEVRANMSGVGGEPVVIEDVR